jgi:hypothetical protein
MTQNCEKSYIERTTKTVVNIVGAYIAVGLLILLLERIDKKLSPLGLPYVVFKMILAIILIGVIFAGTLWIIYLASPFNIE